MFKPIETTLLNNYGIFMRLKIFINTVDNELKDTYLNAVNSHNNKIINVPTMIDSGFDIFTPDIQVLVNNKVNKVDFNIKCSAKMVTQFGTYNTGFYMYPRSSISKTPIRLANNVGIIDAGYRGNLIGMFDLIQNNEYYTIQKKERYLQICAPDLVPIIVEIVESENELGEETKRGSGGFGSTGL
jgi:dUTP pyrophosphatase